MARVSYRPKAEADIDEAFAWYAQQAGIDVAQRFFLAVYGAAHELPLGAETGSPSWQWVSTRLAGLRWRKVDATFWKWLIFYRASSEGIEVVRVLHGSRDIEVELRDEE